MAPLNPQTLRIAAACLIALLLQVAVVPHVSLGGVHPELLLAATLAATLSAGATTGVATGFVCGILIDALDGLPTGLSAMSFCVAALSIALVADHASDIWWVRSLLGALGTLVSVVVTVVAGSALGHPVVGFLGAVEVVLVVGAFNAVLVPLIDRGLGRTQYRRESEGLSW